MKNLTSILLPIIAGFGLQQAAMAENYALLVGVANYPSLDERLQLIGPPNDVKLMRSVLLQKGFASSAITVLSDGIKDAAEPTRENVMHALERLAIQAKTGDFIYLHFAGHGSQQPTTQGKVPPEPDGLDELFLPRDIGKWDDSIGVVQNAIVDSDMNRAVSAIRAKGAFVWAVFDSCHSGTMTRSAGSPEIRFREIKPGALGIPQKAIDAAVLSAPKTRGKEGVKKSGALSMIQDSAGYGGFVAFYAAQSNEQAPETRLPMGAPDRLNHGVFSYLLAETISRNDGISYRQLGDQIMARYPALGFTQPTPLIEGPNLDALVFGTEPKPKVKQWAIKEEKGVFTVAAGSLQQFSEGAIFAILPSPVAANKDIIGYAQVVKTSPLNSTLKLVPHEGKAQLARLPANSYARLVDPNLRLSLAVALPDPKKVSSSGEKAVLEVIEELKIQPPNGVQIEWVNAGQEADLNLFLGKNKLWLLSPDGMIIEEGANKTHSIDLGEKKGDLRDKIVESFQRIAKSTNLLRLASFFGSGGGKQAFDVRATIKRQNGKSEPITMGVLPKLHAGNSIDLTFHNKGRKAIDVTALYIDSDFGITNLYPLNGDSNRIEIDGEYTFSIEIDANTTGTERLIIIATEALPGTPNTDLSFLAQPKLERTRGSSGDLSGLFMKAGFGTPATRGASSRAPLQNTEVRVFNWQVAP